MRADSLSVSSVPVTVRGGHVEENVREELAVSSSSGVDAQAGAMAQEATGIGRLQQREASGWFGIGAPKNTSLEVVDQLNKQINEGLADPKMKARFADLGGVPMPSSARRSSSHEAKGF